MTRSQTSPSYRERLMPPPWAWVVVIGLVFIFSWAFKAGLGLPIGIIVFVVATGVGGYALFTSAPVIEVTEQELRVGKAHIGWYYVGRVATLDSIATKNARYAGADPRAFHVIRSLSTDQSITIEILDDEDPHPYWMISTGDPGALAAAITQAQAAFRYSMHESSRTE